MLCGQGGEVGFTGQVAAHATDGVFDAAILPRLVGVAEEGGEAEGRGEWVMLGELGAVIEGDGRAQGGRQRGEPVEAFEHGRSGFMGLAGEAERARGAFVSGQHGLAVFAEEQEIGFPVAGVGAVVGLGRAVVNRHAVLQELDRTASGPAESAPAGLAAGQPAVPVILWGGAGVDKPGDRLVPDPLWAARSAQPTGDRLGGPTRLEGAAHRGARPGAYRRRR